MPDLKNKALYNSLRMNWLQNPSLHVEQWQIEEYRDLSLEQLFNKLKSLHIDLDRVSFSAFADSVDSAEELAHALAGDEESDPTIQDKIYLLVFELWRRLVPQNAFHRPFFWRRHLSRCIDVSWESNTVRT